MPQNLDNSKNGSPVGFNQNIQLEGLDYFIKNLEKHFFSTITVRELSNSNIESNLAIELDCNFGLLEALHHFEKGTWGNFNCQLNSFEAAVQKLRTTNNKKIDIEEFSLILDDTSIVINRIYNQSVTQQLNTVFIKLLEHTTNISNGLTEIPFEIYIPVFEENTMECEHTLLTNITSYNKTAQDYYSFWGLYFSSEEDAVVYDLRNKSIISGKLEMLNR